MATDLKVLLGVLGFAILTMPVFALSAPRKRPDELGMAEETVTVTNQTGETVLALVHLYVVEKRSATADA